MATLNGSYDRGMNGQLALMATLAAVGGRWLRSNTAAPAPDLMRGNSSFQYVGSFIARMPAKGRLRRPEISESPEMWLEKLRARGATDLTLITELPDDGPVPAHTASAFSNAGTWALLATGSSAPTVWTIGWKVGNQDAPHSRIWSLAASSASGVGFHAPALSVAESRQNLALALDEIRTFAEGHGELSSWAAWFSRAQELLDDPNPSAPYHRDLLPLDATLDRRQLASAVVQGWVFGAMGSWNDNGLPDPSVQPVYERVSAGLYSALIRGLPAAANGA